MPLLFKNMLSYFFGSANTILLEAVRQEEA